MTSACAQVVWLPDQDVWLAVVTAFAVHVYCLSHSPERPLVTLIAPEGLVEATFWEASSGQVRQLQAACGLSHVPLL